MAKRKKDFEARLRDILKKHEAELKELEEEVEDDIEDEDPVYSEELGYRLEKAKSNVDLLRKVLKLFVSCKGRGKDK